QTTNGNVEAKVVCFYRRRDISNSLIQLADKHAKDLEEEKRSPSAPELTEKHKHQLRHRELFLSRQYESLPATHIRYEQSLAETGTRIRYEQSLTETGTHQDLFFYSLVYDPTQKTLLADKGEIRVGPRFQADVPDKLLEASRGSPHANPHANPFTAMNEVFAAFDIAWKVLFVLFGTVGMAVNGRCLQ
ncbi:UNVERIFIED_CONTAM: hypothetical protein FKN15_055451, partial [Acipenser sinensis]